MCGERIVNYPGRPGQRRELRAKKAHDRESAEVIVVVAPNREGPNVKIMQITVSKVGILRIRGYVQQAET